MESPETVGDPPLSPTQKSWVSVAQNKKTLSKYDFEIQNAEGNKIVEVPEEIFVDAPPLWEDFVVGRFLSTAPHVAKIHVIVNKIWTQGDKSQNIEVFEVNSTTVRFRISNPLMRERILKRGMWNIANIPMVVSKWSPMEEQKEEEVHTIPMWVYLKNVPLNMFSWKGLSFITSAVGRPIRLHPETASCVSFDVAKVFVNAELSKGFPKKINFRRNGKASEVEFVYPWLPQNCVSCGKWGHNASKCKLEKEDISISEPENTVQAISEPADTALVDNSSQKSVGKTTDFGSENRNKDGDTIREEETKMEKVVGEVDGTEWVSPAKTSKSPGKNSAPHVQYQIIQASKFSALSEAGEDGEIIEEKEDGSCMVETMEENTDLDEGKEDVHTELVSAEEVKEKTQRISLPRTSKSQHRFVSGNSTQVRKDTLPATSSKRVTRKQN